MDQRMLHITLNTGRMIVQSSDAGWPVTYTLYRPRAPWCATVHHTGRRKVAAATATRLGEIERGVTWAVVELMNGEGQTHG